MLAFFRRALSSWFILGFLGLVLIAMLVTGIGTPSSMSALGGGGTTLAKVGKSSIDSAEFERRLSSMLEEAQQKQPGITMAQMISLGAADQLLEQMINDEAIISYAASNGLEASDALIDQTIANNRMFNGVNGKFSQERYQSFLEQSKTNDDAYRDSVRRSILAQQIVASLSQPATVPQSLVLPYASMGLERRAGMIANFPASTFLGGAAPSEAEVLAFYNANKGRYSVQETRSFKYAIFDRTKFDGKIAPPEQDIQTYYRDNAAKFAAKETRAITQVIVQDQATANKIAEAAKTGTALSMAAKSSGFDALAIEPLDQAAFAGQSSQAVSKAAFSGAENGIIAPIKSGLGWHVIKIDRVIKIPGKTIDQARPEIIPEVTRIKVDETMQDFIDQLDKAADSGQSIDAIASKNGLTLVSTPDLTAGGIAPSQAGFKLDPALGPMLKSAFSMELEDPATSVEVAKETFAYFDLSGIKPAAPRPLADIKDQAKQDLVIDRAAKAARKSADAFVAKLNGGASFADAVKAAGTPSPTSVPVNARRLEISIAGQKTPPPLTALFSLALRKARLIEMPEGKGWFVVYLDGITPGDASKEKDMLAGVENEMKPALANEYGQQYLKSIGKYVGFTRNDEAFAALKSRLSRGQNAQ